MPECKHATRNVSGQGMFLGTWRNTRKLNPKIDTIRVIFSKIRVFWFAKEGMGGVPSSPLVGVAECR